MKTTLVIYHKDCYDGFGAAWVYNLHGGTPGTIYHAALYKSEPPWSIIQGNDVVIMDFSYPRPQLERIKELASSLLIYDHHKTAEEDLRDFPNAYFNMEKSGIGIVSDLFDSRNWLTDIIEDRDLWKFRIPGTREVTAALSTVPFTFKDYDEFFAKGLDSAILEGRGILKYIANYGKKAWESRRFENIGGHVFPIINIQYMNCSEHLDLLMNLEQSDRAASFFRRGDGFWQFSLRSRGDFDVSRIAKALGGGGHKNAAGFEVAYLPWER